MNLLLLANILNGTLCGNDATFSRIVIDSRTVQPGDCFFAIKGEFFDGHDFLGDIEQKKAAVAIVDRQVALSIPTIQVENTKTALINLARFYRESVSIPVVGITGSCGKTTTRALIEHILKQAGNVLASQKSFNNDIGLPLTLFQLKPEHDFAVLEIGTNHPGEIAALTAIAAPTISVVTMVAGVHVEGFGSLQKIAEEKSDIYKTADIAIINADDPFSALFRKRAEGARIITFGIHHPADVMAKEILINENGCAQFTLLMPLCDAPCITLPLLGEHNVTNALAAAAIAFALRIPIEKIKMGLETAAPEYGRLTIKKGLSGSTIIDDSYNANPTSVEAAIKILTNRSDHAILVFGDMKELGDIAESSHHYIGECALKQGVKQLFCYGENSAFAAKAFGKNAFHFMDQQALIDALKPALTKEVTVLVKGSNGMKMINIVNQIVDSH
ncbi:MAG: UDP-N-acetylmuramoyl-tripeptide--D-alanyl-D-alanine ligase [Coxiellaceae bacterium]|nr:UDP-N-acetylmuramoyl-tripeptide--D-alanyl-D-alanine ligase [Coxiellaceae bacterium]